MIRDSILVKREDGTLTKCFLHEDQLVFIHQGDRLTNRSITSETISFSDHPEVRNVYERGWRLSDLQALLEGAGG